MELSKLDKEYLARESALKTIEITASKGSVITDSSGKEYLDFSMGWCVGNLGWEHDEVKVRMKDYKGPSYVWPEFEYRPWVELAELLAQITPGKLKKSFRATGGTEAVEIALEAAICHTGRSKFISIEGAYHGNSIAARNLGSDHPLRPFLCKRIRPPLNAEASAGIEKWLKAEDVAALIMEPIVCNLGVLVPEQEFMDRVQKACRKYGTLIIMDEVATGFGRTGKLFACEHFGIEPDLMCLGKAISGGAAPLAATIATDKVAKSLASVSFPYSTYGWHPLSVEAAIANINYIQKNFKDLEKNVAMVSDYFQGRLSQLEFGTGVEVNIIGLAIGLQFEDQAHANALAKCAEDRGLIVASGEGISMFPALNIDIETAEKGLDIFESCLSELH